MDYSTLVNVYEKLESTTKRLEKTFIISQLLKKTQEKSIPQIILLLQGRVFPHWQKENIGIAARLVLKAINKATGIDAEKIEKEFKKKGDLGKVAEHFTGKKTQSTLYTSDLSVQKVFTNIQKLAALEGVGTVDKKMQYISELLTSAKPNEAKYIVRTLLEELRVGVAKGTLRDAIAWAYLEKEIKITYNDKEKSIDVKDREQYNKIIQILQDAYDKINDFSEVAVAAKKGITALKRITIEFGKPVNVMLCKKEQNIEDAFKRVGKPAQFEYKLDGFRMQIHKFSNKIKIFTRNLEDVTKQFPEVIKNVKERVDGKNFIIDGEAVGFDSRTGKPMPFQHISQRIKRKYNIEELAKKIPVELNLFDIIYYNGKDLLKIKFSERLNILRKIVKQKSQSIVLCPALLTDDAEKAQKFYQEALDTGHEGVVVKDINGNYKPGGRVGTWVKLKPIMETLDLVIVEAEWGEGKRSGWFSSFTLACRDDEGNLLTIGKVGTGFKELEEEEGVTFKEMTELLKPLVISEEGKIAKVKPKVVLEIAYEEIQKSPAYGSGYALRFPRCVRNRTMERDIDDISDLELVEELYYEQKK